MSSSDIPTASSPRAGVRIAVRPHTVRVQPTFGEPIHPARRRASSSSSASKSSSNSKRRSVTSMKGLMPLALSPACSVSSTPSSHPSEERIGNSVDGYFPELLVKDLNRSSSVFATHNMTSGSPQTGLVVEDVRPGSSSGWPQRTASLPYNSAAGRPLIPIQERNSVASFIDHDANLTDTSTDLDSMADTHYPRDIAAACFSVHEQSIITAATSLTSSCWMPSPRKSSTGEIVRQLSWIDPDSEEDEDQDMMDDVDEENMATLSPRPPTPPESDSDRETAQPSENRLPPSIARLHRKSYSVGGNSPISVPRRRGSGRRVGSKPTRSTSNSSPVSGRPLGKPVSPSAILKQRPRASSLQTPRTRIQHGSLTRVLDSAPASELQTEHQQEILSTYDDDDADDEDMSLFERKPAKREEAVFIKPSPPPSPLPTVQSWLNGNAQYYSTQCAGDELAKAVPLPPNVVENLRVSVTCFPETMLLTSSLTVETIRHYSKKVRQPGNEMLNKLAPDPPESPRKSIWKRVVSYRRQSPTYDHSRGLTTPPSDTNGKSRSSSDSVSSTKVWLPLKNVFGCASDYICDALWAHILAYNYISALVPRTPTAPSKSSRDRSSTSNENEEIPKKAASLLGLSVSQDINGGIDRMAKRLGQMPWSLNKETMVAEQSPRSATYENNMRDIQAGLMSSIMRLIATAKLMAEDGSSEERSVEVETRGVDALFVRSLCEIVRQVEEIS